MRSNSPSEPRYRLRCSGCGAYLDDVNYRLKCTFSHAPAMLRTAYRAQHVDFVSAENLSRYARWLPTQRAINVPGRAAVYRSQKLASKLGLDQLWIAFAGWLPVKHASLPTGSFTDLQAIAAFSRIMPGDRRPLVVAAAGDSAVSFARVATVTGHPLVLVVNGAGLRHLVNAGRIGTSVQTVLVADGSAEDLTTFADEFPEDRYIVEGGVANVARRDAAGTLLLEAAETMGRLPDVYVQSVNTGVGALGAYEAALRMIADGRFGITVPQLVLGQNAPNAPIHDTWSRNQRRLTQIDDEELAQRVTTMQAPHLGNRKAPYDVSGGIFEALVATGGATVGASNDAVVEAYRLFLDRELVEISPEAAVGVAALIESLRNGTVDPQSWILLAITGGGRPIIPRDGRLPRPTAAVTRGTHVEEVLEKLNATVKPGAA